MDLTLNHPPLQICKLQYIENWRLMSVLIANLVDILMNPEIIRLSRENGREKGLTKAIAYFIMKSVNFGDVDDLELSRINNHFLLAIHLIFWFTRTVGTMWCEERSFYILRNTTVQLLKMCSTGITKANKLDQARNQEFFKAKDVVS